MEKLSIGEIARAVGAEFAGAECLIEEISTDSRHIPENCLFIALKGDKFDGHDYIDYALEHGAAFAVSMNAQSPQNPRVLYVTDTRRALLAIAGLYRKLLGLTVVGVTGSVGKTTTKEMAACVLESTCRAYKSDQNQNNEIGLSKTILQLNKSHEAAVVEMGMDGPGQIAPLAKTAAPDVGVVTNIGVSHIQAFGSRENIFKEKLSITQGMPDGAYLVLCGDDDLLKTVREPRLNVLFYGIDDKSCPVRAEHITEFSTHTVFEIVYGQNRFDAQIPCMGRHNVYDALAAFSVGLCLSIPPQVSIAALKNYRPAGMRQKIVVHNSYTVVEDCYNASPDSMRAALETLGKLKCDGKRIAVLSDMLELGAIAEESHREMGRAAAHGNIDYLLCTGTLSKEYAAAARESGMENAAHYETQEQLFEAIRELLRPSDVIWFKASRGMKLEQVIAKLYETAH